MKTEKAVTLVFLIGLVFKFMHWPGGGVFIVISLSTIGVLYFPMAFYFFCDKEIKKQNIALSIVSGLFLCLIPIGILFKLQYWPGGKIEYLLGMFSAPVIWVIAYYLKSKSSDELKTYYKNLLTRTTVVFIFGTVFYIIPMTTLIEIQYRYDPELARLKTLSYTHPGNQEYRQQLDDYVMKQDSLRIK